MTDASTARQILGDRYELDHRIARGGMADIFLARDQVLDRLVAIKVLFPQYADDPKFVERFRREAQSAGRLSHANVVAVFDWGAHEETYFIAMEYVEGESLADLILNQGAIDLDLSIEIASRTAAALGSAHLNGMVHRDVKPGNIIITSNGRVKVTDFGIARAIEESEALTQTGKVLGTAAYFSPEQAQGGEVDQRSDLYSLGVVLFEMVTGERPFAGTSPVAIAYKHVEEIPPLASSINPAVPPEIDGVVNRLLAKQAVERYQSAEELIADLDLIAQGRPVIDLRDDAGFAPAPAEEFFEPTRSLLADDDVTHVQVPGPEIRRANSSPGPEIRRADPAPERQIARASAPPTGTGTQIAPLGNYDDPPSRTGVYLVVLVGLVVVAVGLILAIVNLISEPSDAEEAPLGETVNVPTVVGDTQQTATNRLSDAGLVALVVFEDSATVAGQVFRQDPEAKISVEPGSTVRIFVPRSNDTVIVPGVIGKPQTFASDELAAAGFKVVIDRQPSDTVEEGRVVSQSLEADQQANRGAEVLLVISTGPQATTTVSTDPNGPDASETTATTDPNASTSEPDPATSVTAGTTASTPTSPSTTPTAPTTVTTPTSPTSSETTATTPTVTEPPTSAPPTSATTAGAANSGAPANPDEET